MKIIDLLIKFYYRIKLKLILLKFKKVKDLQSFIKWCIFTRIRKINNFKNYGYSVTDDNTTYDLTNHLLKIKIFEDDKFKKSLDFISKDEKIIQFVDLYLQIQNSINKTLKKELIKIDQKPQKAIFENVDDESTNKIKKILKEIIRPDYEEVLDRTSFKIDISLQETLSYLTLMTSIIFCGGFLYNNILFGLYNINISLFFNLSDYVSSSIEQIQPAIIGASLTLIVLFFNLIELKNNFGYFKYSNTLKKRKKNSTIIIIVLAIGFILGSIYIEDFFYKKLEYPAILFAIIFSQEISFKYFKKPLKIFPIILFSSIFFTQLTTKAISKYHIKENKNNIKVIFKNKILNDQILNHSLILATSQYVFFESKNKNVKVFKKDLIDYYEKDKNE
jgi:hypothetical protein